MPSSFAGRHRFFIFCFPEILQNFHDCEELLNDGLVNPGLSVVVDFSVTIGFKEQYKLSEILR
jgi:hypothetical protein